MNILVKLRDIVVFEWGRSFTLTRSALFPVFLYDMLITLIYVTKGTSPEIDTGTFLIFMVLVNALLPLLIVLDLLKAIIEWSLGSLIRFAAVVIGSLAIIFICGPHTTAARTEGAVTLQDNVHVTYTHYQHDQSVHYYMRADERDGFAIIVLCTEDSRDFKEKVYVRCLYQKPGTVMGRPPMRAPGSWVTAPLTERDKRVLEALRAKGVIKHEAH
jgi:hypothetical protein